MKRTFEQALTHGEAQYIASFVHDAATSKMVVALGRDVNQFKSTRVVEFSDVQNVQHRWLLRDDRSVESLLGAHEEQSGIGYQYLLVTDQREIEFTAGSQAAIKDV